MLNGCPLSSPVFRDKLLELGFAYLFTIRDHSLEAIVTDQVLNRDTVRNSGSRSDNVYIPIYKLRYNYYSFLLHIQTPNS